MDIKHGNVFLNVSEKGATLTTFQWLDRHIIFQPQMVAVNGELKLRGGIPIPCPWFGPGKSQNQPQHGFVRDTQMQHVSEKFHSMQMKWRVGDEIGNRRDLFGGSFDFFTSFRLTPAGFVQKVVFTRIGGMGRMPVNMGLHPYFCLPKGAATIELPDRTIYMDEDHTEFTGSVICPVQAVPARITIPGLGTVTMRVGGGLASQNAVTVIWTDSPKYVCVEPVLTSPRDYGNPKGLYLESPGDKCEMQMALDFEPEH